MSKTRTFTGSVTAVNTVTNLTAQGSITSPTLTVPGTGGNKLKRVSISAGADFLGRGNAVSFIRITGDGINGQHQLAAGGHGGQIVTTASSDIKPIVYEDCDIACAGGGAITVAGEMAETDIGSIGIAVTLEFEHD